MLMPTPGRICEFLSIRRVRLLPHADVLDYLPALESQEGGSLEGEALEEINGRTHVVLTGADGQPIHCYPLSSQIEEVNHLC